MAAQLTATGVTFSDGTSLSSKYSVLAQNTVSVFYQAAAPTGWTQVTAHNDKALRLVNGAGGGFGFGGTSGAGGSNFSTVFPSSNSNITVNFNTTAPVSGTVGGHTLTTAEIPDHTHDSKWVELQTHLVVVVVLEHQVLTILVVFYLLVVLVKRTITHSLDRLVLLLLDQVILT